jgi:hypothetical protein
MAKSCSCAAGAIRRRLKHLAADVPAENGRVAVSGGMKKTEALKLQASLAASLRRNIFNAAHLRSQYGEMTRGMQSRTINEKSAAASA